MSDYQADDLDMWTSVPPPAARYPVEFLGPPVARGPRWWTQRALLASTALFLGGALIASLAWWLFTRSSTNTDSITMPARLGTNYSTKPKGTNAARYAAQTRKDSAANAARLSRQYGGAAAAFQYYYPAKSSDSELQALVIRTRLNPLFVYQPSGQVLDGAPYEITRTYGAVQCALEVPESSTGRKPNPKTYQVIECQRSDGELTVRLYGLFGKTPSRSAALVNQLFSSVS